MFTADTGNREGTGTLSLELESRFDDDEVRELEIDIRVRDPQRIRRIDLRDDDEMEKYNVEGLTLEAGASVEFVLWDSRPWSVWNWEIDYDAVGEILELDYRSEPTGRRRKKGASSKALYTATAGQNEGTGSFRGVI